MLPACLQRGACTASFPTWTPVLSFLPLPPGWAGLQDTKGITWSTLGDSNNGLPGVMVIMGLEWIIFMLLAW